MIDSFANKSPAPTLPATRLLSFPRRVTQTLSSPGVDMNGSLTRDGVTISVRRAIRRGPAAPPGIVLVLVLSMLSLFSVLVAGYVVFTSQAVSVAAIEHRDELPFSSSMQGAINQLVSGTNDYRSAAYQQSLLEDLYGHDYLTLRVGNLRSPASNPPGFFAADVDSRVVVLSNLTDETLMVKVPTSLAPWHFDGAQLPEGTEVAIPQGLPADSLFAPEDVQLDDVLTGRYVTFTEGPLRNLTMPILRSFGTLSTENFLRGSIVVDPQHSGVGDVEIGTSTMPIATAIQGRAAELFYDVGPDGAAGVKGVNDDNDGATDEPDECGWPGSDDYGYRFVINGAAFNGLGTNPGGFNALFRTVEPEPDAANPRPPVTEVVETLGLTAEPFAELQYNRRLIGPNDGGEFKRTPVEPGTGTRLDRRPAPDESWDAPDFENLFLAWQPADHRAASHVVYPNSIVSARDLNDTLGSQIIPSFHRPAVVNYLMNKPFDGQTFSATNDRRILLGYLARLRRAVMRPLNIQPEVNGDLDGNDKLDDGTPFFTGSNPSPYAQERIEVGEPVADLKRKILELAIFLANGPWDVDNDLDGIPDSVWVDLNLPIYTTSQGKQIKPLVAPLLEDLDGRININFAGNLRQLLVKRFPQARPPVQPGNGRPQLDSSVAYLRSIGRNADNDGLSSFGSLGVFGRGGGLGPSEIDFSHFFAAFPAGGKVGPLPWNQLNPPRSFNLDATNFFVSRYGNLLATRYGTPAYEYPAALAALPGAAAVSTPGLGTLTAAGPNNESRILHPARRNAQTDDAPMGLAMDIHGVSLHRPDRNGQANADLLSPASQLAGLNELDNQPYEGYAEEGGELSGDELFKNSELIALLRKQDDGDDLYKLLEDELKQNPTLASLITTESRSIDVPEFGGYGHIISFIRQKLTGTPNQDILDRMLAPELRKGAKMNLNRQVGNGLADTGAAFQAPVTASDGSTIVLTDELIERYAGGNVPVINREAAEPAYPIPVGAGNPNANYEPISADATGPDKDFTAASDRPADGQELLARHLYCLMFFMVGNTSGTGDLIPNFPYPEGLDPTFRDRYAMRRLAQWAVNAVDMRDTDAACTRLRYDPDLRDGFDLTIAAQNVVWGMERPEVEISETLAFHDKRLRAGLVTAAGSTDADGQQTDEFATTGTPDNDMDQFRIPQGSAYVELRSLRTQNGVGGTVNGSRPSYPAELFTNGQLDLGRTVGSGNAESPVWRLAVANGLGTPAGSNLSSSVRWLYDAARVGKLHRAKDPGGDYATQMDYLTDDGMGGPIDWTNPTDVDNLYTEWQRAAQVAEVRPVLSGGVEAVSLADDDLDPTTPDAATLTYSRFVWFTDISNTGLNVLNNAASAMKPQNVYFKRGAPAGASNDVQAIYNARALLAPGQFAIVAPRAETVLGQTTAVSVTNPHHDPSDQRIRLARLNLSPAQSLFKVDYTGLSSTGQPLIPRYEDYNGTTRAINDFHVNSVLPIVAETYYPNEVASDTIPSVGRWKTYRDNTADSQEVRLGFNISEPLPGPNYYRAPTDRIHASTHPAPAGSGTAVAYPLVDGYRDNANTDPTTGNYHPDEPLDHPTTNPIEPPLELNGWDSMGTHQEAAVVLLQRLADPTQPWHPVDNPYLTMDFAPMDLTTFNGEGDADIPKQDSMGNDIMPLVSIDGVTSLEPADIIPVRFDTRRKIPDTSRDRPMTQLVQNTDRTSGTANSVTSYDRRIVTQRPVLSSSFNILRAPATSGTTARFNYPLGSLWDDSHDPADSGIDSTYKLDSTWNVTRTANDAATAYDEEVIDYYHPGIDIEPYRQTLGFVNREYGRPAGANSGNLSSMTAAIDRADLGLIGRGTPTHTRFLFPRWADRDYRSPLELMNVPACSATGMLREFSPGSKLTLGGGNTLEIASPFEHLLGFESQLDQSSGSTSDITLSPTETTPLPRVLAPVVNQGFTGLRPPFELIFDVVDTGEPGYDQNRWWPAEQTKFRKNATTALDRLFNRAVEFYQPPYNYLPRRRSPGRVNLNTLPDYIRRTPGNAAIDYLDVGESKVDNAVTTPPVRLVRSGAATNQSELSEGGAGAEDLVEPFNLTTGTRSYLFGSGLGYRALTWGGSTVFDLDDAIGEPAATGEVNEYATQTDSSFGRGFKAFIESRRGYPSAAGTTSLLRNPNLDERYPSQFAGVFATATAAEVPSVRRLLRPLAGSGNDAGFRRTADMSMLRPHPDFDQTEGSPTPAGLLVENVVTTGPTASVSPSVNVPTPTPAGFNVQALEMSKAPAGVFERSMSELHQSYRHLARDSDYRFENAARLKNLTTHHSNAFLLRMTIGFFEVDREGNPGQEFRDDEGVISRSTSTMIIDRSKQVGFRPGEPLNSIEAVLEEVSDE